MTTQTQDETNTEFEKLFARPPYYHSMSEERQWETDKDLGILDVEIDQKNITPEMKARYKRYFG
jgi:hypothetical protein